jgi:hypothetical protein
MLVYWKLLNFFKGGWLVRAGLAKIGKILK